MSIFRNHLPIMGASGQSTGYTIDQSIRFDSAATAHMERTPSSSGNRKIFTSSLWVKLGKIETNGAVGPAVSYGGVGSAGLVFTNTGTITLYTYYTGSSWTGFLQTNRKFRDPSAWYHIVYIVDSTQDVAAERIRLYVNGERETSFANENYLAKNTDTNWNTSGSKMQIGRDPLDSSGYDFDGYLAEMHYLDGYAYGPEYFGEFKEDTDIWTPIKYSGSYGTNGFYLKGQNSSALGDDSSGNNNDFTTSGMAAHDQITDSPTHNFATYNPVGANDTYSSSQDGLSNSNLEFDSNGGSSLKVVGLTIDNVMLDGYKWYFEIAITGSSFNTTIGFRNANNGDDTPSVEIESDGQIKKDSGNVGSATGGFSAGDIFGIRLDWTNTSSRKISFYKNNTLVTGEQTFSTVGYEPVGFMFYARESGSGVHHLNMGQNGTFNGNKTAQGNSDANGVGDFYYAVPSGHFAITHQNLNAVS